MLFRQRSSEKEILDSDDLDTSELHLNLLELHKINSSLGGYRISTSGLSKILKSPDKEIVNILDIGFGGGDSIKVMSEYCLSKNINAFFYGVDLKTDCISYAENNLSELKNIKLICDDYRNLSSEFLRGIDIIHCSLFIHHLNDNEILELFRFARKNNCKLLINDLHRHPLAYLSIKLMTKLFSRSRLVKNDAPISVLRGFTKAELTALLERSGYKKFSVEWKWAFRYLILAE